MRIALIGKFPPIEGGVSARTYWTAHGLAARGHDVHVVTNAKEARPPFRMHMRAEDWRRCEAAYGSGSVTVHWTDPVDRSQSYIPMASPFVTKLAASAAQAHARYPFDVMLSHYMEPYGIAAHLAAQMTGAPHIVRMAGSDAGRLWRHPQFELLYDHVLRSAEIVIAAGAVSERAVARGVDPARIAFGGAYVVPQDVFTPSGPMLDLTALRAEVAEDRELGNLLWGDLPAGLPYFGVYGKLGENKGSFALLAAMERLKAAGLHVGLLAMAHRGPLVERRFRAQVRRLGLADRVLQIPFLPNWRVPEFLRGCLAACALEQDFPIAFHSPVVAREVLLCGACLVASTEMIRKLPGHARLPDGYGCVTIDDVGDVEALSRRLAAIIRDPQPATVVGARGSAFAREMQQNLRFLEPLEQLCEAAARRRPAAAPRRSPAAVVPDCRADRFPLTRLALAALAEDLLDSGDRPPVGTAQARAVLADIKRSIAAGRNGLASLAAAVRLELDIAAAEDEAAGPEPDEDPLCRLVLRGWAIGERDLARLVPHRAPGLRIVLSDCDATQFLGVRSAAQLPAAPQPGPSFILAFARRRRDPLLVDSATARILALSDGTRTVAQIVAALEHDAGQAAVGDGLRWIEGLFQRDLIRLSEPDVTR